MTPVSQGTPVSRGTPVPQGMPAILLLVGWWAGALVAERSEALAAGRWALALEAGRTWTRPALPHPRALRRASGVGPRRSVDLARYLWDHGAEADLEGLVGVGPRTARAARAVLAEPRSGADAGWVWFGASAAHRGATSSGAGTGG